MVFKEMTPLDLYQSIIAGIFSGWLVVIFTDPYKNTKEFFLKIINPKHKIERLIVEALLPLLFLLLMFLAIGYTVIYFDIIV